MAKIDRRVQRTEDALRSALVELILEKGFEATNISEITARANVGRSTFYAHFADKEDLLQGSVDNLREHLACQMHNATSQAETTRHPALAFCRPMLDHAASHQRVFQALVGRKSGYFVVDLFQDMWADFVRAGCDEVDEITVQAIVGGFSATIHWWHFHAPELTPTEVERRFCETFEPILPERQAEHGREGEE